MVMKQEYNEEYKAMVEKMKTKSKTELEEMFDWLREDSNKQLKELLNLVTDEDTRDFIDYVVVTFLHNNWFFIGLLINSLKEDDEN